MRMPSSYRRLTMLPALLLPQCGVPTAPTRISFVNIPSHKLRDQIAATAHLHARAGMLVTIFFLLAPPPKPATGAYKQESGKDATSSCAHDRPSGELATARGAL